MVETVAHPTIGDLKMLGIPFKFSDTPAAVRRPPPLLGEHTDEVLGELGLDAAAIAKLKADKVV
jgi:crotonobetainyl-CoA:carnitine CoA-transferase CaiB-like acyl-CoA transferase